jgi:hypothetical protein
MIVYLIGMIKDEYVHQLTTDMAQMKVKSKPDLGYASGK